MKRREFLKATSAAFAVGLFPRAAQAGLLSVISGAPTLPQANDPVTALARQQSLAATRVLYNWTTNYPFLPGVPKLGTTLPPAEAPSMEWTILEAQTLAAVTTNLLAWIAANPGVVVPVGFDQVPASLGALQSQLNTSQASYGLLLGALGISGNLSASVVQTLQQLQQTLQGSHDKLWTQLKSAVQESEWTGPTASSTNYIAGYNAMFQTQALPIVAPTFRDDKTFANLRVAGANPMMIARVRALPAKLPLTNAHYQQVMGAGDSLTEAIGSGRLYIADYDDLGGLAPTGPIAKEESGVGYAYKPMALFAVPKGGTSLVPVAIQCDQDPARFPIFLPAAAGEAGYWAWQMAKTVVQQADFNHHEMYTHLGRTHLFTEVFALATHRQLATSHPLYALLLPHFEGTFVINDRAALEIVAPKMFAEILVAPQRADTVNAVAVDRLKFDFYDNMFPTDLRARGVDDAKALPDYPFRDDGLLLWQAISDWVTEYIALYYTSDRDVTNDTELTAWVEDIAGNGQVKGFIRITSRAQLAQVVTSVIFNASVQHAAVNFPQKTIMTYVPSTSGTLSAQAPSSVAGQTEESWKAMLPPPLVTVAQVLFLSVLGSIYYKPLGQYRSATAPVGSAFTDARVTAPMQRFQAKLQAIETTIQGRNTSRATPYTTLLPSLIPASTNI